jgi:hypothetical protein
MMTLKMKYRPRCAWCNRPLGRYMFLVRAGEPVKVGDVVGHPSQPDRRVAVVRVTELKGPLLGAATNDRMYSVWTGDYGYDGANWFCTKTCGCRHATDQLDEEKRNESRDDD